MPSPTRVYALTEVSPQVLSGLCRWSKFWQERPNLFPDDASAGWFIRSRRKALIDAGVLFSGQAGYLVDHAKLDALLPVLLGVHRVTDAEVA